MHIDFQLAPWGMVYAAMIYVLGNAVWTNELSRKRLWLGWLMWSICALLVLVAGAAIEVRLNGEGTIISALTEADGEKHWIITTLFALLSVPGAASVLLRQSLAMTRLAVSSAALLVFIPLGMQLHDPEHSHLALSVGIAIAVVGLTWLISALLDAEPSPKKGKHGKSLNEAEA